MSIIKELFRRTFLYKPYREFSSKIVLRKWEESGKPIPPPHYYKQNIIKDLAEKHNIKIFIETGTYRGDMIQAMMPFFEKLYSMEIFKPLYEKAVRLFKNHKKVKIQNGDSGELIKNLLGEINEACLFWLDGHFSGEGTGKTDKHTPIVAELETIFNHSIKNHIILIDDARLFNGENDYPTIKELEGLMSLKSSYNQLSVENDLILILNNIN